MKALGWRTDDGLEHNPAVGMHSNRVSLGKVVPAGIVTLFVMSGMFKGIPAVANMPIDFTILMAILAGAVVFGQVVHTGLLPRQALYAVTVFLCLAVPLLWTTFTPYAEEKVGRLFVLTFMSVIGPIFAIRDESDAKIVVWAWVAVSTLVTLIALVYPVPNGGYAGAAYQSLSTNTIGVGRAAGIVVVVCATALFWRRGPRWLLLAMLFAGVAAMLNAGARGPLLAAAVAIIVASAELFSDRSRRMAVIVVAALLVIAGVVFYRNAPELAKERIASGIANPAQTTSGVARLELWNLAWTQTIHHPVGLGWGGFEAVAPSFVYPHDIVLEVGAEGGVFAALALFGWMVYIWRRTKHLRGTFLSPAVRGLICISFLNAAVSGDINDNRLLFLALGIGTAAVSAHVLESRAVAAGTVGLLSASWGDYREVSDRR